MLPQTMIWDASVPKLTLLDQTKISFSEAPQWVDCFTYEDVATSIERMVVRGAPAIGVAAAYGAALAANENPTKIHFALERLGKTRPTAVNLFWAIEQVADQVKNCPAEGLFQSLATLAERIHRDDIQLNKTLSFHGEKVLPEDAVVITHCNAGAIATGGYGTALGVLRAAIENGKRIKVYADETRPRLQGALLTAWELYMDGIDVTVITDSMAAFLMRTRHIDAVITGADRIAANGDTANKIGTYSLAIAAKYHGVPFYIAAPLSTVDAQIENGAHIPIEERSGKEIRELQGVKILGEGVHVWNPGFDVTPAELITGIITEKGVLYPPFNKTIEEAFTR